jgi:CrcB protein
MVLEYFSLPFLQAFYSATARIVMTQLKLLEIEIPYCTTNPKSVFIVSDRKPELEAKTPMDKLLWIAVAGAFGTLSRYGLSVLTYRLTGNNLPWGTILVNLSGCFLFGLIWAIFDSKLPSRPEIRTIIFIGFFGAFTTFSTFAMDTTDLMLNSQYGNAITNILIHNILGIAVLGVGLFLGKMVG